MLCKILIYMKYCRTNYLKIFIFFKQEYHFKLGLYDTIHIKE